MQIMDDLKLFEENGGRTDSHLYAVRVFSEGMRMEFGLSKGAVLITKRGKGDRRGINIPDGSEMKY